MRITTLSKDGVDHPIAVFTSLKRAHSYLTKYRITSVSYETFQRELKKNKFFLTENKPSESGGIFFKKQYLVTVFDATGPHLINPT